MRTMKALGSLSLVLVVLGPAQAQAQAQAQDVRTGADAFGSWQNDAPGVRRHIQPAELPKPTHADNDPEEPDFKRMADVVAKPDGAQPKVPAGFTVEVLVTGLDKPRVMRRAPNGDIFVAESGSGRVLVLSADAKAGAKVEPRVFAEGLNQPYGIVFHPAKSPRHVYVAAADQVVRYPYAEGEGKAGGQAEVIVDGLPTKRHWTRDLELAPDGERIFLSVGSASNVAATMPDKSEAEIQEYEKTHGLGATWGEEENRGVVRVLDPDGKNIRNYATGLRNCSGMAMQPQTGQLWCTGNERDHIGPELVPDYLTSVRDGGFYGWPWYYIGANEDPAHAGKRPDLKDKVDVPEVLIQAHSSTMDLVFYDGEAFPDEYRGDAFATLRGSWNREQRTGYKVIRALMEDGKPTGVYEDFMTGFVLDDDSVWGRPVGIVVAQDGSLLVSDDANGAIFRISHNKGK